MPGALVLLALQVHAAEPVLGPSGWIRLGPDRPAASRGEGAAAVDQVSFDPDTCEVEVRRVDLDGGPGYREVRLARVYTGAGWEWEDDWTVRGTSVYRPGRAPVPRARLEPLEVDADGRVTARTLGARRIEILREDGRFVGMREGPVEVRIAGDLPVLRGTASDGRQVRYHFSGGWLDAVVDELGASTAYQGGARLEAILRGDGGVVAVTRGEGTAALRGADGAWSCRVEDRRTEVVAPGGGRWRVERDDRQQTVVDPAGVKVITRYAGTRIEGWTDGRGGSTRLLRDADGRVVRVTAPDEAEWGIQWRDGRLRALLAPGGGRWEVRRTPTGALVGHLDPAGRELHVERDRWGHLEGIGRGLGSVAWQVGGDGLVERIRDAVGGELRVLRDAVGRVETVVDAGGGEWRLGRGVSGAVETVVDPAGGTWRIVYDRMRRPAAVTDPTGRTVAWSRRTDGRLAVVEVDGRARWEILRGAGGEAMAVRDPLARRWTYTRDAARRAFRWILPDGSAWSVRRDGAGDLAAVGDVTVERDLAGRPRRVEVPGQADRTWTWDAAGHLAEARSPGVALRFVVDAAGSVGAVGIGGEELTLTRDGGGRVVAARGPAGVTTLTRDLAGRITGWRRGEDAVALGRDLRGLVTQVREGEGVWTLRRDAVGRLVAVEAPGGVRLGADRDPAGRATLLRLPDGGIVRFVGDGERVEATAFDAGGASTHSFGWAWDTLGRLVRLRVHGDDRVLARDPLGALAVVEGRQVAWSSAPGRLEGPGHTLLVDPDGRGARGTLPGAGAAWGVATRQVEEALGEDGALTSVTGEGGAAPVEHDALGRLTAWGAGDARVAVERDELGRVTAVGGRGVLGWEGLLRYGSDARVSLPEGGGWAGGGVVLDPRGTPALTLGGVDVDHAPSGLASARGGGEAGAGGTFLPLPFGPLLGLVDALDPLTGQPTRAPDALPWAPRRWEARGDAAPWADPDGALAAAWDPAAWAPTSPWLDPLRLLVEAGELPDLAAELGAVRDPALPASPGLPWLPPSLAPAAPAPLLDADRLTRDDDPIVRWVLRHAGPPVRPPAAEELVGLLIGEELRAELALGPPALADGTEELLRAMLGGR